MVFQPESKLKTISHDGYVLPLVIITGMILFAGALMLSSRSFSGLMRSTRQKQADEAIEIAETGASILINELNSNFPYLLTVSCKVENNSASEQFEAPVCEGWEDFEFSQDGNVETLCPTRSDDPALIMDRLYQPVQNERGSYRLRNYEFLGDQTQGGKAVIQVQGQRFRESRKSSDIAASAIVEQEITITPKYCDTPPFAEPSAYALQAENIDLANGDVLDEVFFDDEGNPKPPPTPSQANVHCVKCATPDENKNIAWDGVQNNPNGNNKSIIDGERSSGQPEEIPLPPAPEWDKEWDKKIGSQQGMSVGSSGSGACSETDEQNDGNECLIFEHNANPDSCFTEAGSPKITHCKIDRLVMSGKNMIRFKPENGEIRLYAVGQQIALSGNTIIGSENYNFGQVAIFGSAAMPWKCDQRELSISGTGMLSNLFLHMPCWDVKLSGSVQVKGAALVKEWISTTLGFTDGNNNALIVPPNAAEIMRDQYDIGEIESEFVALGSNRWSLIQMEQE